MSKDNLDIELAGMTSDQLENVRSRIEVILRERDAVPVEAQLAPSTGEVWGKIVAVLQAEGREAVELMVKTPYQETVILEIRMVTPRPARH